MSGLGTCIICTSGFYTGCVSALPCGHVFHYECVLQWVQSSKTCPICRIRCLERSVIKQLFFTDGASATQSTSNAEEQVEKLSIDVKKIGDEALKYKNQCTELEKKCNKLGDQLNRANEQSKRFKDAQLKIEHLQAMLEGEEELKRKLGETNAALKASRFYKMITDMGTKEENLKKYIKNGDPNDAQFMKLLRRQVEDARAKQAAAVTETKKAHKRITELKQLVQALREAAQKGGNLPEREDLAAFVNQKRPSLGFEEERPEFNDSLLQSALRPAVKSRVRGRSHEREIEHENKEGEKEAEEKMVEEDADESMVRMPAHVSARLGVIRPANGMGGLFSRKNPFDRLAQVDPPPKKKILVAKNGRLSEFKSKHTLPMQRSNSDSTQDRSIICLD